MVPTGAVDRYLHALLLLTDHGQQADEDLVRLEAYRGAELTTEGLHRALRIVPHGQPIPGKDVTWPKLEDSPLVDVPPGTGGLVSRVLTDNAEAVAYLHGVGVRPGATLILESISPFEGPVAVRVEGKVVPASVPSLYLNALALVSRVFKNPSFREAVRTAPDVRTIHHLLEAEGVK